MAFDKLRLNGFERSIPISVRAEPVEARAPTFRIVE